MNIDLLWQEHRGAVRVVLLEFEEKYDVVDELMMDTFLAACESEATYKAGSSEVTWLCGIAKNIGRNYLRDRKRQPELVYEGSMGLGEDEYGPVGYDETLSAVNPADDPANASEADDLFEVACAQMPEQMAICVRWRRKGYSNTEIAEMLQTTEAVVRSQISQSRQVFDISS